MIDPDFPDTHNTMVRYQEAVAHAKRLLYQAEHEQGACSPHPDIREARRADAITNTRIAEGWLRYAETIAQFGGSG